MAKKLASHRLTDDEDLVYCLIHYQNCFPSSTTFNLDVDLSPQYNLFKRLNKFPTVASFNVGELVSRTTTTAAERRADIIAATIRVLARDGIAETTTRKISAEAEVNQATLRYYFGSKDDLLFAVLQEMMQTTREVVQAGISSNSDLYDTIAESIKD